MLNRDRMHYTLRFGIIAVLMNAFFTNGLTYLILTANLCKFSIYLSTFKFKIYTNLNLKTRTRYMVQKISFSSPQCCSTPEAMNIVRPSI